MASEEYVLGFSEEEIGRLRRQAGRFAAATERVFRAAGIGPGMRVLDLGCGAGDVSILVGNLVGPGGSVVAVDRDPRMLAIARRRSIESPAPLETLQAEILSVPPGREFDAVVGRFVMMYQTDPVAAVARLALHLRPGGRFAFVEPDYSIPPMSRPSLPLWDRVSQLIAETFGRTGTPTNVAFDLHRALAEAGCARPEAAVVDAFVHFAGYPYLATHVTVLRSLLPEIERLGLATAAELDLDTLVERLDAEAVAIRGLGRGSLVFGVWGFYPRVPTDC
jgi:ubiquinone/menaquinone biosynthesis C-methylase UbiE